MEKPQLEEAQAEHIYPTDEERISLARAFGGRSLLREILETVLLTIIIFLALNTATGRFQVRGSSMEPTLHNGQYLVISKLTYWIHPPERGDIIVFHPPNSPAEDYIKRIVGLPGEQVEVRGGEIWVDSASIEEPYITNPGPYSSAWSLGDGEYFVLGDNRGNSNDSHSWGVLPEENIVGKAWLCYWPPEEWGMVKHYIFPGPVEQED
ncbi:MAG: signal peptidase I [Chloroflexota bacterium]|nr:signal peptidase I [Chloroflexota bacterium]